MIEFSEGQQQLVDSGDGDLSSKSFCDIKVQLTNPNKSSCVSEHKYPFKVAEHSFPVYRC